MNNTPPPNLADKQDPGLFVSRPPPSAMDEGGLIIPHTYKYRSPDRCLSGCTRRRQKR